MYYSFHKQTHILECYHIAETYAVRKFGNAQLIPLILYC
jgi:hypothetical protein